MADNNILLLVGAALLLMMAMGGGDKESQKSSIGDRPFDDPDQMLIHDDEPWREPYYEPEKGKPKKMLRAYEEEQGRLRTGQLQAQYAELND